MDDWQLSRSANIVIVVIIVLILAAIIVLLIVAFNSWNNDNNGNDDGGGGTAADDGAISGGDLFPEAQKPQPPKPAALAKSSPAKSSLKPQSPPRKSNGRASGRAPDASGDFEDFSLKSFSLPADSVRYVRDTDGGEPSTATDPDLRLIEGSIDLSARVQLMLNQEPMREMSLSSAKTPAFSSARTPEFSDDNRRDASAGAPPAGAVVVSDDSGESVADPQTSSPPTQELEADAPRAARRKTSLAVGEVLNRGRSSTSYVEEETSGQSVSVPASEHPHVPSDFSSLTERPHGTKRVKDPVAALAKISKE